KPCAPSLAWINPSASSTIPSASWGASRPRAFSSRSRAPVMQTDLFQALMGQDKGALPLGAVVNDAVKFLLTRCAGAFDAVGNVVETFAGRVESFFLVLP